MVVAFGNGCLKEKAGSRPSYVLWAIVLLVCLSLFLSPQAVSAVPDLLERIQDEDLEQVIRLRVGRSKVLRSHFPIRRISVADPEIADIVLISDKEIYVNGNAAGVTNISLWGKQRFSSARVSVEPDVSILKEKLYKVLPKEKIAVEAAGDTVVLSGEVSGPTVQETALSLATPYAGGKKE